MTEAITLLAVLILGVILGTALTIFILYCIGKAAQEGP